jgi:hypothetical protein
LSILAQCCPWMSLDCPFLLNVSHECLWIVHSCSMLPMNVWARMDNPETFMGNIEQEWTIQRHSWVTLSKNGQSRDIHGQHGARVDNPETFMGNIEQEWTIQRHSWVTLPWMSLDCPFLPNVTHECLWIVHSCSMLPMNVSGLSTLAPWDNPETFMGNIEQEWTIQRHSWATLSKNGQSRDIHG